jgi:phosphoribosylformimino-5-aminoimidazole carboxamide ribotide isomerase
VLLIPAIDLKNGQCVRLRQGDPNQVTVFSDDPVAVAQRWVDAGARRLHVVDLDGAANGKPANSRTIGAIAAAFPDTPLQVGGGIRDEETVERYLEAGVQYVVIGTRAVKTPHFVSDLCLEYPGHVLIGIDTREGKIATDGWSKLCNHGAAELAQHLERDGVAAFVFTDISRDGMLSGANIEATAALARATTIPVIASGGVADLDDVRALCAAASDGIVGAIIGRALYEGQLDFAAAQALADEHDKITLKEYSYTTGGDASGT